MRVESWATIELEGLLRRLQQVDGAPGRAGVDADRARVDQLRLLEQVKGAAAAAQARVAVAFEASQLAQQEAAGVSPRLRGRGIGDQVALARGAAASQGARHLGFAHAMQEMPHTSALLSRGEITEWVATLLVRETAALTLEDRQQVDDRLCAATVDPATGEIRSPRVLAMTPRRVRGAAHAVAAELDPAALARRAAKAAGDRRVTCRPAPDTMTYVTGLLPVAQGVACWAGLRAAAKALKAAGDERTESQLMADLFVARLTGKPDPVSGAAAEIDVPVEVQLVMSTETLLGLSDQPARIGEHVVPGPTARDLATRPGAPRWLRRLFTDPRTGVVTDIDAGRRRFSSADSRFLQVRDQHCRFPGCDSPIDDADHVRRAADDGPSTRSNGQGLCERHNLVKEAPGWHTRVTDARPGRHTVTTTTPTGHTYQSQAPPGLSATSMSTFPTAPASTASCAAAVSSSG